MRYKYIYKHKKTGRKVYTNEKLDSKTHELVTQVKDGMMRSAEIMTK